MKETLEFITQAERKIHEMNGIITDELLDRSIILKNSVETGHDSAIQKLTENYTRLRELLSEISVSKVEVLDKFKDKILARILMTQQNYGLAMSDIVDGIISFKNSYKYCQ